MASGWSREGIRTASSLVKILNHHISFLSSVPGISENLATAIQARLRNTYGDTQPSGYDFDSKLIDHIASGFLSNKREKIPLSEPMKY